MASNPESTSLVPNSSRQRGKHYRSMEGNDNLGALEDGETEEEESFTEYVDNTEQDHKETLSSDDFFLRLRHAHIATRPDTEQNLKNVHEAEKREVQRNLLRSLKDYPVPIKQKLSIIRTLHHEILTESILVNKRSDLQQRKKRVRVNRSKGYGIELWRAPISKITAYFGSSVGSYFVFLRQLLYINTFMVVVVCLTLGVPEIFIEDGGATELSGQFGTFSTSIVFYGAYSNITAGWYDMPLAYFFTWSVLNCVLFILIVISMYFRFRRSKLTDTGTDYTYASHLFTIWDHSVSEESGCQDQITSTTTIFKEMIREESLHVPRSLQYRLLLYTLRFVINVIILGMLGGSGYLIYYVANKDVVLDGAPSFIQDFWADYQLPFVVAGLKLVVPPILKQICKLELWPPRTELKLTLARTTLFYFASLIVFMLVLYGVSFCPASGDKFISAANTTGAVCCWENQVGEEVFKVVLFDLGILILAYLCLDVLLAFLVKFDLCCKAVTMRDFDVSSSVLELIYGQGLVWLGFFFVPFLPVLGMVKLFVMFYLRYFIARWCNEPSKKLYRASSSGNFYLALLLVDMFVTLFLVVYSIVRLRPSEQCGPFREYEQVYDVVGNGFRHLPDWLDTALTYVVNTSFILPFICVLILLLLYFRVKVSSYQAVIKDLRKQLTFERKVERRKVFARARTAGVIKRRDSKDSTRSNVTNISMANS